MMTTDTKKGILGIGLGLVLFWLLTKAMSKKEAESTYQPEVTEANASIVLDAYMSAVRDGAGQADLNDLNMATASEYGIRAYLRKSDGKFVATDLSGKEVKCI